MSTPENPLVTMTAKGIEDMIGKAIAPFVEDNRRLRLAFGYATAISSEVLDKPAAAIVTELLGVASRSMQAMPKDIPADLLILAGQEQWEHRRNLRKLEGKPDGDRQDEEQILDFKETMQNALTVLIDLFCDEFGEDWYQENEDTLCPSDLLPNNYKGHHRTIFLWTALRHLEPLRPLFYSDEPFVLRPKEQNQ